MMLGSDCQGLELRERRWSHGGAGVLWWCREKRREKEMKIFLFCEKEKSKRERVFENFSGGDARQWLWSFGVERKRE